jgi:hypothetical protein
MHDVPDSATGGSAFPVRPRQRPDYNTPDGRMIYQCGDCGKKGQLQGQRTHSVQILCLQGVSQGSNN